MPPIYQTSTYVQDAVGAPKLGYDYSRVSNPTRNALQANLAALESGRHGMAFASGLAAIEALLKAALSAGDHLVCGADVYGGVDRMLRHVWSRFGIEVDFVDTTDLEALRSAVRPETKLIHVETPSNPMMTITDIQGCSEIARESGCLLSVDNTFATPYLQRPLELGADVVIAVDITAGLEETGDYSRGLDIMVRANAIKDSMLVSYLRRLADIVIDPDIRAIHWADFSAYEQCITAGMEATAQAIPRIRHLLRHERVLSVLRAGEGRRLAEAHLQSNDLALRLE